jgi:plasmid stability protein
MHCMGSFRMATHRHWKSLQNSHTPRCSERTAISKTTRTGPCVDMCITCKYVHSMAKMIQVRNVPDALHRSLKARAAMAGMSLSDYLLGELREIAERPTLAEFRERLHKRKPLPVALDTSGLLREERTAR